MAVATIIEEQKKKIEETALITGSEAIAVACKLADVDVITAYPIRPYDTVMQYVCKLVANGEMDCEYIVAEGEHSQFEIVKHVRRARVLRVERRRLDVCHGSADGNSGAAHSHDRHGGKPGAR
jgi:Pyruvate flavodoxin/ferredoxin oxidoreductase, thiamine diP-bdg